MDSGVFTPEGFVYQPTLDYYGARAAGGFGLIIIEISAVERRGVGMPDEPALWTDESIPGMTKLANIIKKNGARTIVQMHHAGRETVAAMAGEQIAAPSSVPCPTNRETPHEFSTQEVYDLIQHYVDAAVRCQKAGFDGVEIHASHGYMGGQFLIAAYPPFKQSITRAIRYMLHMCKKNGVDMKFDTEATPELIKEMKPDVLIMATGATPIIPPIPGLKETGVVQANEVLLGSPVLKQSCLIIGGEVGVETAEYATDYCTKVSLVEMLPVVAEKLYLTVCNALLGRFKKEEVDIHCNTKVLEFIPGGVIAECNGEKITMDGYDHVILALGSKSYVPFDAAGLAPEVITVGDAVKARDAKWAIYEAYRAVQNI